jgi:hypothetical protein
VAYLLAHLFRALLRLHLLQPPALLPSPLHGGRELLLALLHDVRQRERELDDLGHVRYGDGVGERADVLLVVGRKVACFVVHELRGS